MSSSTAYALVWNHSRATAGARLVLLAIAEHDGEGGSWPSIDRLAKFTKISPRSVQRALEQLEQLGELRVYRSQGGTATTPEHLRPNLYEITLACPPYCDGSRRHRDRRDARVKAPAKLLFADAEKLAAELGGTIPDPFEEGVTPTSGGDAHVRGGVTPTSGDPLTPTSPELTIGTTQEDLSLPNSSYEQPTYPQSVCAFGHPLVFIEPNGAWCAAGHEPIRQVVTA